jgi:ubiquinol-cytochrome c reductase cytochrome b subunit
MFGALAVLFVLPWLDTSKVRSMRYRPVARQFFFLFVIACLALGWAGGQNPALSVYTAGDDRVTVRWFEGSEVRTEQVSVSDSADLRLAMANAEVALRDQGAVLVLANATGQTSAEVQGVFGGTERSEVLSAKGVDEANAMAAELLAGLPSGGVAEVTPQPAFRFTVTMLSQLLTAYYFAFFLLILPLLGLREQPSRVPDTIAKAVAAKAVPATAS